MRTTSTPAPSTIRNSETSGCAVRNGPQARRHQPGHVVYDVFPASAVAGAPGHRRYAARRTAPLAGGADRRLENAGAVPSGAPLKSLPDAGMGSGARTASVNGAGGGG